MFTRLPTEGEKTLARNPDLASVGSCVQIAAFATEDDFTQFVADVSRAKITWNSGVANVETPTGSGISAVVAGLINDLINLFDDISLVNQYTIGNDDEQMSTCIPATGQPLIFQTSDESFSTEYKVFVVIIESVLMAMNVEGETDHETFIHWQGWLDLGAAYVIQNLAGTVLASPATAYQTIAVASVDSSCTV